MAGVAIASYGISDPEQADEHLLPGLTYIYPTDPIVSNHFPIASVLIYHLNRPRNFKKITGM